MRTFGFSFLTAAALFVALPPLVLSSNPSSAWTPRGESNHIRPSCELWASIGSLEKKNGRFAQAAEAFRQADAQANWLGDGPLRTKCLMSLGVIYWDLGEMDKSRRSYEDALAIAEKLRLREEAAKCRTALSIDRLYRLGKAYDQTREFGRSCASFNGAIKLAKKLGSLDHEAKCLRWLGAIYLEQKNLDLSYTHSKRALEIYELINNDREKGFCLTNLALYFERRFRFPEAINCTLKSLHIAQERNSPLDEVECLVQLAVFYSKVGYLYKAIDYCLAAEAILQRRKLEYDYEYLLDDLGYLYRQRASVSGYGRDLTLALDYYYLALQYSWQKGDMENEAQLLNNIGFALFKLGRFDEALGILRSGCMRALRFQHSDYLVPLFTNQGHIYFAQAKVKLAKDRYGKAIELWQKSKSDRPPWDALWGLGRCLEKEGTPKEAYLAYLDCLDMIGKARGRLALESEKAEYLQSKLVVYESLVGLIFNHPREWPADSRDKLIFSVMEGAKANSFIEELDRSGPGSHTPPDPEFARQERALSRRISSQMKSLLKTDLSSSQRSETFARLTQTEDLYTRLRNPGPGDNRDGSLPEPSSLEEIQAYLERTKSAALEFFLGGERSYLALVTGHNLGIWQLPARATIESSVRLYIKMLAQPPVRDFGMAKAARRIYKELLFPLSLIPNGEVENLVIVPDGLLNYLPFETLSPGDDGPPHRARLVLDDYCVSYVPSLTSLLRLARLGPTSRLPKDLLAVGAPDYDLPSSTRDNVHGLANVLREVFLDEGFSLAPLPYSQREVKDIASDFAGNRVDLFLHERANEATVKRSSLTDYRVIHFACHGFLDERNPLRSALVLSQTEDENEDGFLQTREILNLRTRADLVVLSACQTGKGCLERGEGILGISRVFFFAGAKSVVSALWAVSDRSTCLLMRDFYSGLRRGLSKSRALREAKLRLAAAGYAHPFYWAPFVLNGEFSSGIEFR